MASIFTKIVNGEIPCYKIAEEEKYLAFLDVFPLVEGHTLVIPKQEVDNLFDLPQEAYEGLMRFARKVAKAQEKVFDCNRVGVAVIGLEVPHAHVHLIPINRMADMDFTREKQKFSQEQFEATAAKIRAAF